MPAALIILILGLAGWAWWTGRLGGVTYDDAIAATFFLLGLRLLTTGKLIIGAALMATALLWAAYRRKQASHSSNHVSSMDVAAARALLGLPANASLADIREAHRRLIAKVHPDAGGSTELANRVNAARDILVAEINRRQPRES
jgi:hypothetical protein